MSAQEDVSGAVVSPGADPGADVGRSIADVAAMSGLAVRTLRALANSGVMSPMPRRRGEARRFDRRALLALQLHLARSELARAPVPAPGADLQELLDVVELRREELALLAETLRRTAGAEDKTEIETETGTGDEDRTDAGAEAAAAGSAQLSDADLFRGLRGEVRRHWPGATDESDARSPGDAWWRQDYRQMLADRPRPLHECEFQVRAGNPPDSNAGVWAAEVLPFQLLGWSWRQQVAEVRAIVEAHRSDPAVRAMCEQEVEGLADWILAALEGVLASVDIGVDMADGASDWLFAVSDEATAGERS